MAKIFTKISEWRELRKNLNAKTIGFVPTMGNLHGGHESLLMRSKAENNCTVLSIFVNPTQFNNSNDLKNYPRTLTKDLDIAEKLNIDYLLIPSYEELYSDQYNYKIAEERFSKRLEGKSRPGHFSGVLTVVLKLLNLIKPHKLYLGEKDFQQLQLIKGMVDALFIDTEIISCPTVRDKNNLALSSRNSNLTIEGYKLAGEFAKQLASAKTSSEIIVELEQLDIVVDYIEEHEGRRYGAVEIDNVRLIDNVVVK